MAGQSLVNRSWCQNVMFFEETVFLSLPKTTREKLKMNELHRMHDERANRQEVGGCPRKKEDNLGRRGD